MEKIVLIVLLSISTGFFGQQLALGQRKGLLQTTASIYPSVQFNKHISNIYLGGHFTYFFQDNYSFRGDIYGFTSSRVKAEAEIKTNTIVQAGFARHFVQKSFDAYVGIQTGISAIKGNTGSELAFQPIVSPLLGIEYHVFPYFYFYAEAIYNYQLQARSNGHLDQLLFTGGLGLQLPTKKLN